MPDLTHPIWRKSTFSSAGGSCVEVATLPDGRIGIRDSKDPSGPALDVSPGAWSTFIAKIEQDTLGG